MTTDKDQQIDEIVKSRLHRSQLNDEDPREVLMLKIRNVLNIIFMLGAIVGMGVFYFHNRTMGTIIILTAMAFKIAECCFRFIRQ